LQKRTRKTTNDEHNQEAEHHNKIE